MANSGYYYNQYRTYKTQASNYSKDITNLTRIRENLINNFYDEQGNVNRELNELKEDLNKSIRHENKFNYYASCCELYNEKSTTADSNLNSVVVALDNEIAELNRKKYTAEQNRDANYNSYNSAKQEEYQAWLAMFRK